jgi:hypothetical protein
MNLAPPLLPKPRSYFHVVLLIAGWTVVPWVLVTAWLLLTVFEGRGKEALPPLIVGGACLAVLVLALLMGRLLQGDTLIMETGGDDKAFLRRLNFAAAWLGYFPAGRNGEVYAYRPTSVTGLLGGRIFIRMDDDLAIFVGPRRHVHRLRDRLITSRSNERPRRASRQYAEESSRPCAEEPSRPYAEGV